MIDDDPDAGEFIRHLGMNAGYRVTITSSFQEFKTVYADRASIIVIDLMMPDVDGVEVLRFLRSKKCSAGLILVSAVDQRIINSVSHLARRQGLCVIRGMQKPFAPNKFAEILNNASAEFEKLEDTRSAERRHETSGVVTAAEISNALERDEFRILYQPKITIGNENFLSVEALLRWQHPVLGLLRPRQFIHVAESDGLIDRLTEVVMARSFPRLAQWLKGGLDIYLSLNLSPRSLVALDLPDRVAQRAQVHGLPAERIILEVTESWLISDVVPALDVLSRFRIKGFGLSIDDFGTGYATLGQLREIPFTELKIDRSFISGARANEDARTIADSSVRLGRRLKLNVVAEGVETLDDWKLVKNLGCDMAQGYFIAKPLRGDDVADWFIGWRARADIA